MNFTKLWRPNEAFLSLKQFRKLDLYAKKSHQGKGFETLITSTNESACGKRKAIRNSFLISRPVAPPRPDVLQFRMVSPSSGQRTCNYAVAKGTTLKLSQKHFVHHRETQIHLCAIQTSVEHGTLLEVVRYIALVSCLLLKLVHLCLASFCFVWLGFFQKPSVIHTVPVIP